MKKFLLCTIFMLVFLSSCSFNGANLSSEELTTDTWSAGIANHEDKIKFMEKYIKCPTEVLDAEYHIVFQDNSKGLVPGPSDWRIAAAIRVHGSDIDKWISDMEEVSENQIDQTWWAGLAIQNWDINNSVSYYKRPNEQSYLAVYPKQGILLKYFYTA